MPNQKVLLIFIYLLVLLKPTHAQDDLDLNILQRDLCPQEWAGSYILVEAGEFKDKESKEHLIVFTLKSKKYKYSSFLMFVIKSSRRTRSWIKKTETIDLSFKKEVPDFLTASLKNQRSQQVGQLQFSVKDTFTAMPSIFAPPSPMN